MSGFGESYRLLRRLRQIYDRMDSDETFNTPLPWTTDRPAIPSE